MLTPCSYEYFTTYVGTGRYDSKESILQDLLNVNKDYISGVFIRDNKLVVLFFPTVEKMNIYQFAEYIKIGGNIYNFSDATAQYTKYKDWYQNHIKE